MREINGVKLIEKIAEPSYRDDYKAYFVDDENNVWSTHGSKLSNMGMTKEDFIEGVKSGTLINIKLMIKSQKT